MQAVLHLRSHTYFLKIRNMSLTVDQLESYDRSNLEVIRLEFMKLQKKLEKCRDEQDDFSNAAIGNVLRLFILKCLICDA